jgi:hypothetical protein
MAPDSKKKKTIIPAPNAETGFAFNKGRMENADLTWFRTGVAILLILRIALIDTIT